MMRLLVIAAAMPLLWSCTPRNCDDGPPYPQIGGCIANQPPGAAGGPCLTDNTCNSPDLACASGTCYPCGAVSDPREPCCGEGVQGTVGGGTCPRGGQCAKDGENLEWFTCQGTAMAGCEQGAKPNHAVWTLDDKCGSQEHDFCAPDNDSAQQWIDQNVGNEVHGPLDTPPTQFFLCGTDKPGLPAGSCILGSGGTEQMPLTVSGFDQSNVMACEPNLDPNCDFSIHTTDDCSKP